MAYKILHDLTTFYPFSLESCPSMSFLDFASATLNYPLYGTLFLYLTWFTDSYITLFILFFIPLQMFMEDPSWNRYWNIAVNKVYIYTMSSLNLPCSLIISAKSGHGTSATYLYDTMVSPLIALLMHYNRLLPIIS